ADGAGSNPAKGANSSVTGGANSSFRGGASFRQGQTPSSSPKKAPGPLEPQDEALLQDIEDVANFGPYGSLKYQRLRDPALAASLVAKAPSGEGSIRMGSGGSSSFSKDQQNAMSSIRGSSISPKNKSMLSSKSPVSNNNKSTNASTRRRSGSNNTDDSSPNGNTRSSKRRSSSSVGGGNNRSSTGLNKKKLPLKNLVKGKNAYGRPDSSGTDSSDSTNSSPRSAEDNDQEKTSRPSSRKRSGIISAEQEDALFPFCSPRSLTLQHLSPRSAENLVREHDGEYSRGIGKTVADLEYEMMAYNTAVAVAASAINQDPQDGDPEPELGDASARYQQNKKIQAHVRLQHEIRKHCQSKLLGYYYTARKERLIEEQRRQDWFRKQRDKLHRRIQEKRAKTDAINISSITGTAQGGQGEGQRGDEVSFNGSPTDDSNQSRALPSTLVSRVSTLKGSEGGAAPPDEIESGEHDDDDDKTGSGENDAEAQAVQAKTKAQELFDRDHEQISDTEPVNGKGILTAAGWVSENYFYLPPTSQTGGGLKLYITAQQAIEDHLISQTEEEHVERRAMSMSFNASHGGQVRTVPKIPFANVLSYFPARDVPTDAAHARHQKDCKRSEMAMAPHDRVREASRTLWLHQLSKDLEKTPTEFLDALNFVHFLQMELRDTIRPSMVLLSKRVKKLSLQAAKYLKVSVLKKLERVLLSPHVRLRAPIDRMVPDVGRFKANLDLEQLLEVYNNPSSTMGMGGSTLLSSGSANTAARMMQQNADEAGAAAAPTVLPPTGAPSRGGEPPVVPGLALNNLAGGPQDTSRLDTTLSTPAGGPAYFAGLAGARALGTAGNMQNNRVGSSSGKKPVSTKIHPDVIHRVVGAIFSDAVQENFASGPTNRGEIRSLSTSNLLASEAFGGMLRDQLGLQFHVPLVPPQRRGSSTTSSDGVGVTGGVAGGG
ncbi:unnamed protein product, partial [Amoebophrya sp. A25]